MDSEDRTTPLIHLQCRSMPTVASLEELERAAAEFEVGETRLVAPARRPSRSGPCTCLRAGPSRADPPAPGRNT